MKPFCSTNVSFRLPGKMVNSLGSWHFSCPLQSSLHRTNKKKASFKNSQPERSSLRKRGSGVVRYLNSLRIWNVMWKNIYIQHVQFWRGKNSQIHTKLRGNTLKNWWSFLSNRIWLISFHFSVFTNFLEWLHITFIVRRKQVLLKFFLFCLKKEVWSGFNFFLRFLILTSKSSCQGGDW